MIKKDICETEVRATGFKKFQEDIMLTSKKIEEYNDELKRLNHAKNKLVAAGEKETKAYREITKELYNMSEAADSAAFAKARGELKQYQNQMAKIQQGIKMTNASFKNQKPTAWTNLKQLIPIASRA